MSTATEGRVVDPTLGRRVLKWWWVAALAAGMVIFVILSALTPSVLPLDPTNPRPDGAKAVAEVLRYRAGVTVQPVHRLAELGRITPSGDATLVVVGDGPLPATLDRLADVAPRYRNMVVIGDPERVAEALDITVGTRMASPSASTTACQDDVAGQARVITGDSHTLDSGDATLVKCFRHGYGYLLVSRTATDDKPRVDFLANAAIVTNERILDNDNAALALRLLSRDATLVWYVPDGSDELDGEGSDEAPHLPAWASTMMVLAAWVAVGAIAWRGRRLGRLVVEPLPVTIRATETTRSRGRLYNAAGDHTHSLRELQEGARRRLAKRLSVPRGAPPDRLTAAVQARSGRSSQEIAYLLYGPAAGGDQELVARARALAALEEECR